MVYFESVFPPQLNDLTFLSQSKTCWSQIERTHEKILILSVATSLSPSQWGVTSPSQILAEAENVKKLKVVVSFSDDDIIAREPESVVDSLRIWSDEKSDRKIEKVPESATELISRETESEADNRMIRTVNGSSEPEEEEEEKETSPARLNKQFH